MNDDDDNGEDDATYDIMTINRKICALGLIPGQDVQTGGALKDHASSGIASN